MSVGNNDAIGDNTSTSYLRDDNNRQGSYNKSVSVGDDDAVGLVNNYKYFLST